MLNFIDSLLNKITMYRLVLYVLTAFIAWAMILNVFGVLTFEYGAILITGLLLTALCLLFNKIFSWIFKVPTNHESAYITAFILTLILPQMSSVTDLRYMALAALVAMGSKYILAYRGKHIFNPAALAVTATFYLTGVGAAWWIGSVWTLPVVLIGGLLVVRKIQRFDLVLSFLITSTLAMVLFSKGSAWSVAQSYLIYSSTLFFTFIMLTEPLTTPPTRRLRVIYGVIVGLLLVPNLYIGNFYFLPETALLVGNIFAFLVSPKGRPLLTLKSKNEIAKETFDFSFNPNRKFNFKPGQYMEFTVPDKKMDMRGNRRYFTIASSPTEEEIKLGIKFYEKPSTFKRSLQMMKSGDKILAGQLSGDFTLPDNQEQKLAFIAGGIGITPFRSMIKYLVDKKEKRNVVLFYCNREGEEPAYKELFDNSGVKVVYISGRLDMETLKQHLPDFKDRKFYISGPHGMVSAFESTLSEMGVSRLNIKTDFFPGYV